MNSPTGHYLLFKFGLDEQYSSLKVTVNASAPNYQAVPHSPGRQRTKLNVNVMAGLAPAIQLSTAFSYVRRRTKS